MHAFEIFLVVAWALTLATTILNVLTIPRLKPRSAPRAPRPVSVVIPARNEEESIEQTVRAMLAQTYASIEVIVVDDRSSDRTREILDGIACDDARLRVVIGEETPDGWLGKPWALEQGTRVARGEMLLLVDADLHYSPDAITSAVAYMDEHPDVAMIVLFPRFEMRGFGEQIGMPMMAVTALMFMPVWLSNRTTHRDLALGGGTGNLVRREAFEAIGGYARLHDAVVDDVGLSHHVRASGRRTQAVLADRLVSLRMYRGAREIVEGFTKNVYTAMGGTIGVSFLFLLIFGHLLPYALALRGDGLAIVAVILLTAARTLTFLTLRYRLVNALFGHPFMAAMWCWIFIRSMWKTGIRKELHWRGRRYAKGFSRFGSPR
jgi:chlorobactene glucosyltransferase